MLLRFFVNIFVCVIVGQGNVTQLSKINQSVDVLRDRSTSSLSTSSMSSTAMSFKSCVLKFPEGDKKSPMNDFSFTEKCIPAKNNILSN